MKTPARAVIDNIVWGVDGTVWAFFRVDNMSIAWRPTKAQLGEHARIRSILMGVPANSVLLGVVEPIPIAEIGTKVVTPRSNPQWRTVTAGIVERLKHHQIEMFRRRYYIGVELPDDRNKSTGTARLRSAITDVSRQFGIGSLSVSASEIEIRKRQVTEIRAKLGASLRPCGVAEIRWLYARSVTRGLSTEPFFDERRFTPDRAGLVSGASLHALLDVEIYEGGHSSDENRPRHRRYLRIDSDQGTTYTSFACIADMPQRFTFPGAEWLARVDDLDFPVDWCVRIKAASNDDAQRAATKQARELQGQIDQYAGDPAGPPPALAVAMEAIDEERGALSANRGEPELQATMIYSASAATLPELEQRMAIIAAQFRGDAFSLPRPTGGQLQLLTTTLPGSSATPVCADYKQFLLSADLAAGAPFCGTEVGDPAGLLLGFSEDGGLPRPVYLDPFLGPLTNRSGSMAAVGALGSGKSQQLKRFLTFVLANKGQAVALDRTASGEYVRLARKLGPMLGLKVQVVKIAAGEKVLLDPMRVFDGLDRARFAIGFLTTLTGFAPTSHEGSLIDDAVRAVTSVHSMAANEIRLDNIIEELERQSHIDLARRIRVIARSDLAHLAFGDGLAVDLNADLIVFHIPQLSLPGRTQQSNAHLSSQMLPEHYASLGIMYLVAAMVRRVMFHDSSRLSICCADEVWALRASIQTDELLTELVRDGRKHNAAVWLASQHPNDFAGGELLDLLPVRFVFAQAQGAANAALQFLGASTSDHAVELVSSFATSRHGGTSTPGLCLMKDIDGRVGHLRCVAADSPELAVAYETNPGKLAAMGEPVESEPEIVETPAPLPDVDLRTAVTTAYGLTDDEQFDVFGETTRTDNFESPFYDDLDVMRDPVDDDVHGDWPDDRQTPDTFENQSEDAFEEELVRTGQGRIDVARADIPVIASATAFRPPTNPRPRRRA
jgi:hypothetical protein